MSLQPGSGVPMHRHNGDVHVYCLTGTREILGTGEIAGPGSYVYEPGGTVDAWRAIGDEPCVLHLKITGTIDYVGADGEVAGTVDAATQCEAYLDWCAQRGTQPDRRILGGQ
jgi:quercetin dioxygenase-like cupin family protein